MKKYNTYKVSGVEWIEEIPEHWDIKPLKSTTDGNSSSFMDGDWIESPVITDDGIRYLTTGNVGVINYKEQGNGYISEQTFNDLKCSEVFPGDILISRLNLPLSRCCLVPELGKRIVTAVDNVIYRPDSQCHDKRYMVYLLNSARYAEYAGTLGRGTTMKRISRSTLATIKVCVPPLSEQQTIASYLDRKVGQIDASVSAINTQIDDLKAYRMSVISEAVTKGLNPNVTMKDSGVEWIGEIPEGWEITKLAWAFPNMGSGTTPDSNNLQYYVEEGYNWLQTGDLTDGAIVSTSKHLSQIAIEEKRMRFYPIGSFVIAMYGATIGKLGYLEIETSTNQACCVLPPQENRDNKFMFYVMLSSKSTLISKSIGGGQPNISQAIIQEHRIPVPPLSEQQAIATYLCSKTAKIDAAIASLELQRDDLNALKQSIISEAVTGKIDVRDWKNDEQ